MTRLIWTGAARADLARIDDYYAEADPAFPERMGDNAIAAGRILMEWPHAGSLLGGEQDFRKWPVKSTPYIFIYRILGDRIEILRVRHDREDWRSA
ncbi:MAG: type II toxin-antitoxin system RelE/ParE family toxin [Sphingomonadaceae bacterium]